MSAKWPWSDLGLDGPVPLREVKRAYATRLKEIDRSDPVAFGDLRRALDDRRDVHDTPIDDVMVSQPKSVSATTLAARALDLLEKHRITALPVVDEENRLIGALNIHDLFRAGLL